MNKTFKICRLLSAHWYTFTAPIL